MRDPLVYEFVCDSCHRWMAEFEEIITAEGDHVCDSCYEKGEGR
jgi:formylmethanofuran dehydrogenase subunit E